MIGEEYEPPSPMFPSAEGAMSVAQPTFRSFAGSAARVSERSAPATARAVESSNQVPALVEITPAMPSRKRPRT